MVRAIATYAAVSRSRAAVRDFRIQFAYGRELRGVLHLDVPTLEAMQRDGEITSDAFCAACGEHVIDCSEVGPLLIDWPERVGFEHDDGLTVFTG